MPLDQLSTALDTAAKFLALLASLVGLIIAVNQLSAVSRFRKRESWAAAALEGESGTARRNTLQRIVIEARAQQVARIYVPTHHFLPVLVFLPAPPAALFMALHSGARISTIVWYSILAFFGIIGAVSFAFDPIIRRQIIVTQYRRALPVKIAGPVELKEGNRRQLALSCLLAASLSVATAGVATARPGITSGVSLIMFIAGSIWAINACVRIHQYSVAAAEAQVTQVTTPPVVQDA